MFGYFRPDPACPIALRREYKKYYCCLCHALKREYGTLARWTLSYDVAFYMLLVAPEGFLQPVDKIRCAGTTLPLRQALAENTAQKAAALNLLLTFAKLEDDIQDENRTSARVMGSLLARPFRKAMEKEPRMWQILKEENEALRQLEEENGQLSRLEEVFARMMVRVARECFALSDPDRLACLEAAARWLYFIDAADDLDRDLAKGCFNPFTEYGSFAALKDRHYRFLTDHYAGLFADAPLLGGDSVERQIVDWFLCRTIPRTTVRVLTERGSGT